MYTETRVELVCTYDSEADAAYVYLEHPVAPGGSVRNPPFDPQDGLMANLDLDAEGRVLGLEILGAGSRLPVSLLRAIVGAQQP